MTCFLIDDDADDQEIFAIALADLDPAIRCCTADNGPEALDKLKNDESFWPDFIFIDLNMPRMSGKQCLAEIKKIDRLRHVPVIVFSTSSASNDIRDTHQLGAAGFLTKPSSIAVLTSKLADILTS
jgi:CheY-like chemotaxis protein